MSRSRLSNEELHTLRRSVFPQTTHLFHYFYQVRRLRNIRLDSCVVCGRHAKFECPKCIDLGLPLMDAAYCSRRCYRKSWASHNKLIHDETTAHMLYCLDRGLSSSPTLPLFDWTGALRPNRISRRLEVHPGIVKPDWAVHGKPKYVPIRELQNIIEVKTQDQIQRMRQVCLMARTILDAAALIIRAGITTNEIDALIHRDTVAAGGYPSSLNYYFFPKSCYTSVNEVICHGIPDMRVLEDGDIVKVSVTVYYGKVHGCLSETFFVGNVDEESKRLVKCAYECLEKAISIVKPSARFRNIGDVISEHASMSGFSVVKSYCGHGIGKFIHCAPFIPNYAGNKVPGLMWAGQTFTINPMINSGGWQDCRWPDGWTAVTCDGRRSAQFEHTVLVTATGVEVLTARLPNSPNILP